MRTPTAVSALTLVAIASFAGLSCERHSWEETKALWPPMEKTRFEHQGRAEGKSHKQIEEEWSKKEAEEKAAEAKKDIAAGESKKEGEVKKAEGDKPAEAKAN